MRRTAIYFVLLVALVMCVFGTASAGVNCTPSPGPSANNNTGTCFPTPQECATGNYNGVYNGGPYGRGAVCAGGSGHIGFYAGGNANNACGVIIVADTTATGNPADDPNLCA